MTGTGTATTPTSPQVAAWEVGSATWRWSVRRLLGGAVGIATSRGTGSLPPAVVAGTGSQTVTAWRLPSLVVASATRTVICRTSTTGWIGYTTARGRFRGRAVGSG